MEKDINDYKEEYSRIEIIPSWNDLVTFIEDSNKKSFFHYYINNKKEELKRNYILRIDNVQKIKVIIDKEIKSFSWLFKDCVNNKLINFIDLIEKILVIWVLCFKDVQH